MPQTRREFLHSSLTAAGAAGMLPSLLPGSDKPRTNKRPKVAAVYTVFRFRSHAYDILENFFKPYLFRGKLVAPGVEVASFYADQFLDPKYDMTREVSKRFDVPVYKSIREAVCLGGKEFAVDAVLSIGEHGNYPYNDRGQKMYPRKRFFDEITQPMLAAGKAVPLYNDKHLSYRWDEAKAMYDVCDKHGIPLMAGSSVPLAQRIPPLEIPNGAEFEQAVSIHGGGFETYDFHGLELLQSFVESRKGGETGVSQVQLLHGETLQKALRSGRISQTLVNAAMQAEKAANKKRQPYPNTGKAKRPPRPRNTPKPKRPKGRHAIEVTYKDGFRAAVLTVPSSANRWNFACRLKGDRKPQATMLYNGPWGNRCLFKALSHAIQHLFVTHKQPYPVERTLLVTGVLEAAVRSFNGGGKPVATPHLEFGYTPIDFSALRENGASWEKITPAVAQPIDFSPGDAALLPGLQ